MGSAVTVGVVGTRDLAKELGKKGTQSDITLFNSVRDGHAATLVEPTQFPEKLASLLYALGMADRVLFAIAELSREVAETAATVDLFDAPVEIALGPLVGETEIRKAFRGTRLESAPTGPIDLPRIRGLIEGWSVADSEGPVDVRIDHAFPVKGVGAVALGVVRRGELRAHEQLRLYPTEKIVEVRSIQVHDADVKSASTGERVGVALKGVDADELTRGQTLAPSGSLVTASDVTGRILQRCPYFRGRISLGAQLHLLVGLAFVPATVVAAEAETVRLEIDRPIAFEAGSAAILTDLSASPGPRVAARVELMGPHS